MDANSERFFVQYSLRVLTFLVVCLSFTSVNSLVKVISPSALSTKYPNITISLARFGEIDYRKQEEYEVVLPPTGFEDGCEFLEFAKRPSSKKIAILFKRGNCPFSKKANVALKAGADLAIVYKLESDVTNDNFIPVADGKTTKFLSPLFVVSHEVGSDFRQSILANNKVLIYVDFDTQILSPEPNVNFWMYTGSKEAYSKLIDFIPYYDIFQSNSSANLSLRFVFPTAYETDISVETANCYTNLTYCSIGLIDSDVSLLRPTELIDESLRQICIFKTSRPLYWNYVKNYLRDCLSYEGIEQLSITQCSWTAFGLANTQTSGTPMSQTQLETCFNKMLGSSPTTEDIKELAEQAAGNPFIFSLVPALSIGTYVVRGEMEPLILASSICDSFNDPPKALCSHLGDVVNPLELSPQDGKPSPVARTEQAWKMKTVIYIVLAVVGAVLLFVLLVFMAKKAFSNDILPMFTANVDQSVYNYMKMKPAESDKSLQDLKPTTKTQDYGSSTMQTESGFEI